MLNDEHQLLKFATPSHTPPLTTERTLLNITSKEPLKRPINQSALHLKTNTKGTAKILPATFSWTDHDFI